MVTEGPGFSLYEQATLEDRCAQRSRLAVPATLRQSGGKAFQTVVRDLSVAGFCAGSLNRMHVGTICWLTMPGLEALQSEVMWWNNSLVGCAFSNLISQIVLDSLVARWPTQSDFRIVS